MIEQEGFGRVSRNAGRDGLRLTAGMCLARKVCRDGIGDVLHEIIEVERRSTHRAAPAAWPPLNRANTRADTPRSVSKTPWPCSEAALNSGRTRKLIASGS